MASTVWSAPAFAQEGGETERITEFGAAPEEAPAAEPGDFKAMLAVCDRRLEACEQDAVGVEYLAAAYMALWGILIAFLLFVRRGQRRLERELADLEARLGEAEGRSP